MFKHRVGHWSLAYAHVSVVTWAIDSELMTTQFLLETPANVESKKIPN